MEIDIAHPIIAKEEKEEVLKVLKSGMLTQGKWVEEFEKKFAKAIGTKFAIATSSGTTALHLALLALGIGKGDEVITTPFSFIASANTILYTGAKPVFADIDERTFNINPDSIEKVITKKTKTILPVHLYGLPCDMNKILKIAKRHRLFVIEDACQAHGAKIDGITVGSMGDIGCFSFYPTKNMTTGEGGMITTDNPRVAQQIRLLRNHGMPVRYQHNQLGFNFRMTNIAAAIGIHQLKKLNKFNQKRIANAKFLTKKLSNNKNILTPFVPKRYKHVFHQYTIRVNPKYRINRDRLKSNLEKNGIGSEVYYPIPIHKQKLYKKLGYDKSFRIAEKIATEVLSIPVHPSLSKKSLRRIANAINKF